jgi:hypothetical protein
MLKSKIFLSAFFIVLIIASLLGMIVTTRFKNNLTENVLNEFGNQEKNFASQIGEILSMRITNLQERLLLLSEIPQIKNGDSAACNKELDAIFDTMKSKVGNLSRTDAKGIFNCSIVRERIGLDAKSLSPTINKLFEDADHKAVLTDVIISPVLKKYAVSIYIPLFDDKNVFLGSLSGTIYLDEFYEKYLAGVPLAKNGYIILQDENGDVIYHPNKDLVGKNFYSSTVQDYTKSTQLITAFKNATQGKSGTVRESIQNEEKVISYIPTNVFPNRQWIVYVAVPVKDILATLDNAGFTNTFFNIAILFACVLFLIPALLLLSLLRSLFLVVKTPASVQNSEDINESFVQKVEMNHLQNMVLMEELETVKLQEEITNLKEKIK